MPPGSSPAPHADQRHALLVFGPTPAHSPFILIIYIVYLTGTMPSSLAGPELAISSFSSLVPGQETEDNISPVKRGNLTLKYKNSITRQHNNGQSNHNIGTPQQQQQHQQHNMRTPRQQDITTLRQPSMHDGYMFGLISDMISS